MATNEQVHFQDIFDRTIGRLDHVISKLVMWGRLSKKGDFIEEANQQTLKHHAEDMIAAGEKILKDLGEARPTMGRTDAEITEQLKRANDAMGANPVPGTTYEMGVRDTIDWMRGNTPDKPMDDK